MKRKDLKVGMVVKGKSGYVSYSTYVVMDTQPWAAVGLSYRKTLRPTTTGSGVALAERREHSQLNDDGTRTRYYVWVPTVKQLGQIAPADVVDAKREAEQAERDRARREQALAQERMAARRKQIEADMEAAGLTLYRDYMFTDGARVEFRGAALERVLGLIKADTPALCTTCEDGVYETRSRICDACHDEER